MEGELYGNLSFCIHSTEDIVSEGSKVLIFFRALAFGFFLFAVNCWEPISCVISDKDNERSKQFLDSRQYVKIMSSGLLFSRKSGVFALKSPQGVLLINVN